MDGSQLLSEVTSASSLLETPHSILDLNTMSVMADALCLQSKPSLVSASPVSPVNPVSPVIPVDPVFTRGSSKVSLDPPVSMSVSRCSESPKPHELYLAPLSSVCSGVLVLRGSVSGRPASLLVDSGASSNFLSESWARTVHLKLEELDVPRDLILADGTSSRVMRIARKTTVCIGGYRDEIDFYVTSLGRYNLILGTPWLRTVNPMIDWKKSSIYVGSHDLSPFVRRCLPLSCSSAELGLSGNASNPRYCEGLDITSVGEMVSCYKQHQPLFLCTVSMKDAPLVAVSEQDIIPTKQEAAILQEFADVFKEELPPSLPPDRGGHVHRIELLPNTVPPARPPYRLSPVEAMELKKQLDTLLAKGFIQPSSSPFGAPVVFAPKPDGGLRMCLDYRALNKITKRNAYPLPNISDIMDQLQGAKVFSKVDLCSGYYQILMDPADVEKTAFRTKYGHFEFKVLPFGLTNAPATFMALMNKVLYDLIDTCVVVYLDDILVASKSWEEHERHLRLVLQRLREAKLYAKPSKCRLFKNRVDFLGFILSADGIEPNPTKVQAIAKWPSPTSVLELQSFLGVVNYYRRFVKHLAVLASPLFDLLKKGASFTWLEQHEKSFSSLKQALLSSDVLAHPDPNKPYVVNTDASIFGVGATLSQYEDAALRPVAFESRKLSAAEKNYPVYELEMLAVIYALTKWRHLLEGHKHPIQLLSDHQALKYFMSQQQISRRQARWLDFLAGFNLDLSYLPGKANIVADALSRRPDYRDPGDDLQPVELSNVSLSSVVSSSGRSVLMQQIRDALASDSYFRTLSATVPNNGLSLNSDGYLVKQYNGVSLVYVPTVMRTTILQELHECAGHFGIKRTVELLLRSYWWPSLRADVESYVKSCKSCMMVQSRNSLPPGLLQPIPVPQRKWDSISMDFITHLPKTSTGNDTILVVVDRFTKMAHFIAMKATADAPAVAKLFIDHIYRLHGMPSSIISDRDSRFTSRFWRTLMSLSGSKLSMSTAFHPQTDGQTERVNRILEDILRHYVSADQKNWDTLLSFAEFTYNNKVSVSTGYSPFYLQSGQHPRTPAFMDSCQLVCSLPSVQDMLLRMKELMSSASDNIIRAQCDAAKNYNKKHKELLFHAGDKVMLSTVNLSLFGTKKLNPRWIGPFPVIKVVSPVAYMLELPLSLRAIHNVFHISLLKPFVDDPFTRDQNERPGPELIDDKPEYEVECIVDMRSRRRGRGTYREFLVKWLGYPSYENTWEPERNLANAQDLISDFLTRQPLRRDAEA